MGRRLVIALTLLLSLTVYSTPLKAQSAETEERLTAVEERLARLEGHLERLIELLAGQSEGEQVRAVQQEAGLLAQEIQAVKETAATITSQEPAAISASVVSAASTDVSGDISHVPYAGYMELHVNNDGLNPTLLDFHRFVLMFGHGFGDRIRFWSELELEHAFVEGGEPSGEIELEQAYLDFLINPKFNLRTGMVLIPVGIINERHEPPSFNGVERPFVDTLIIPTTWSAPGAGFVGDLGKGFTYKTYLTSSLDGTMFSAEEGFRDGRRKGFFESARNMAWSGRLEYRGLPGLNLGTSFWTGETGFDFQDLDARATLYEFDGRYRYDRFQGRGQFVITHLDDAAEINELTRQQTGINPNNAERMRGFYLEGGASLFPSHFTHDLVGFYRYENFDTQFRMPTGFLPLNHLDRSAHILGLTYYPYPDVSFKFDYNIMRNNSQVIEALNRWNLGVGWWF